MKDIRDFIFKNIQNNIFNALLISEDNGVFSGSSEAYSTAEEIGVSLELYFKDGDVLNAGDRIGSISAAPKNMAIAEEKIIGSLAKFSGIATAARKAVSEADGKIKIVAGSWKKMPPQIKDGIRKAVAAGGASFRICDTPMLYLDKNYIKMFGSIKRLLEAVKDLNDVVKVLQIKGIDNSIEEETKEAVLYGCSLLMVDTGKIEDAEKCISTVNESGIREKVQIAFAGNVKIDQISEIIKKDIDILCIGKDIVDAKLLDIKLDVINQDF